jgi:drug/metabolite transporter (DMT)-like permease
MAILIGLIGVMIIIRPGPEGFTAAALLCVASVASTAGRDLATRSIAKDIPSLMITTVTAISVGIFGALMIPFLGGWQPVSATSLTHLLLASVLVLVGYQSVILAMRTGEISFVAPFRYTSLIFSALLGFFFFAEVPDVWTLAGAAVVIASGLYTFYREAKRHVPPVAQESAPRSPV